MFSKNFLSFSKSENIVNDTFPEETKKIPNKLVQIKFILEIDDNNEHYNNIEIPENNSSNPNEEEVLFFPNSCFIIEKIEEKKKKEDMEFKIFSLKYFHSYDKKIEVGYKKSKNLLTIKIK